MRNAPAVIGTTTYLLVVSLGLAACRPEFETPPPRGADTPVVALALPPAPRPAAIDVFPCDSSTTQKRDAEPMALLAGSNEQSNEAHDCQRLVVDDEFGPLVGIFPIEASVALAAADSFDNARVVASIYNWGATEAAYDPYAPLRIARGWSCLWLIRQDVERDQWDAAVMPADRGGGCLLSRPVPLPDTQYFQVYRTPYTDVIPQTARWAWDHRGNGQHYIGIKCAVGWCSIGANGFRPAAAGPLIPGWYDEQQLAVAGADGRLVPGPWGRIEPYPRPRDWEIPDFVWQSNEGGRRIGTVTLRGDQADLLYYANKRGFDRRGKTDLWLYKRDTGDETTGWQMLMVAHDPRHAAPRPDLTSGTVVRVSRISDVLHASPGAVRWRWSETDEATWSGCGKACCTPQT